MAFALLAGGIIFGASASLSRDQDKDARALATHMRQVADASRFYWLFFGGSHMIDLSEGSVNASYLNAHYGNASANTSSQTLLNDISAGAWPVNNSNGLASDLVDLLNTALLNTAPQHETGAIAWLNTRWGEISGEVVSGYNTWGRTGFVVHLAVEDKFLDTAYRAAAYLSDLPHAVGDSTPNAAGGGYLRIQVFSPLQAPLGSMYSYALAARGQPTTLLSSLNLNGHEIVGTPPAPVQPLPYAYLNGDVFDLTNSTANNFVRSDANGLGRDWERNVTIITPNPVRAYPVWQPANCILPTETCWPNALFQSLSSHWHANAYFPDDTVFENPVYITGGIFGATHRNTNGWDILWRRDIGNRSSPVFVNDIHINALHMRWTCVGRPHGNGYNREGNYHVANDYECIHANQGGDADALASGFEDRLLVVNDVADRNWKYDPVNMGSNANWDRYVLRQNELTSDARMKTNVSTLVTGSLAQAHRSVTDLAGESVNTLASELDLELSNATIRDAAVLSTLWGATRNADARMEELNTRLEKALGEAEDLQ